MHMVPLLATPCDAVWSARMSVPDSLARFVTDTRAFLYIF
jgi:hypothetical protein